MAWIASGWTGQGFGIGGRQWTRSEFFHAPAGEVCVSLKVKLAGSVGSVEAEIAHDDAEGGRISIKLSASWPEHASPEAFELLHTGSVYLAAQLEQIGQIGQLILQFVPQWFGGVE